MFMGGVYSSMNESIMRAAGFGKQVDLVKAGKCPFCKKPAKETDFTDYLQLKEFKMSGMCVPCQVDFFQEDDE
jgi:hypothetical protein